MANIRERLISGQLQGCYFYTYHSHQPYLVNDGSIVGNLTNMWNSGNDKDRYEARMFYQCYLNPAQHIRAAFEQGKTNASCMVDFSGTLVEDLVRMGKDGIFTAEGKPDFLEEYRKAFREFPDNLELLLIPWSHPYLDGGCPEKDIDRQIGRAFEQIEDLFGTEVRSRVKGLFPPELGLPSDPDVLYTLIESCRKWGLKWMMVNEASLEDFEGNGVPAGYPYELFVKNREDHETSITVLTRVHDIYQSEGGGHAAAKSYLESRLNDDCEKPLMIGSAGDLENGGVMMNEHWGPWLDTVGDSDDSHISPATGTVFIEAMLAKAHDGVVDWGRAESLFKKVRSKGGSWTYSSEHWTEGENKQTLDSISQKMSDFYNELVEHAGGPHPSDDDLRHIWYEAERALFILETSCYRYWGDSGDWMEAGFALVDYAEKAINKFAEKVGDSRRLGTENNSITLS
ncbi:MAG: hypothetical protein ACYTFY_15600 [Planctomycetota bacterium]|jgi:hypothetical protein